MHELVRLLTTWGIAFAALNVFVEQLGVPVPAFPTLVVAGALAREGVLHGGPLALAAVAAAVAADLVWFFLGRRHGGSVLRLVCRLTLSPDSCVRRTENLFDRLGLRALLVAKFVPGLSAVATPMAGAAGSRLGPFLLFDTAGAFLWSGSALLIGALFFRQIAAVLDALSRLGGGAVALLLGALALFLLAKAWERHRFATRFAMTRIAPEELAASLRETEPPTVWDVRSPEGRRRDGRTLPGARLFRLHAVEEDFAGHPLERGVVLYCT